jgi:hypothetical protein
VAAKVYIGSMRHASTLPTAVRAFVLAGALLAVLVMPAGAQLLSPDYTLTAPSWMLPASWTAQPDMAPRTPVAVWGAVRLAAAGSASGSGLSLEAGENWFARAGIGRSIESDVLSVGAGYRFAGGDALSMHVTRQLGQERLGLAVRYDWRRSYLRLAYEQPLRTPGSADRLRFSAGVRF